eukprot:bmy_03338T0
MKVSLLFQEFWKLRALVCQCSAILGNKSGGNFCTFPLSAGAGLLVPLTRHETLGKALNISLSQFSYLLTVQTS